MFVGEKDVHYSYDFLTRFITLGDVFFFFLFIIVSIPTQPQVIFSNPFAYA